MTDTRQDLNDDMDKVDSITTKLGTDMEKTFNDFLKKQSSGQDFSAERAKMQNFFTALQNLDQKAVDADPGDGSTIVPPTPPAPTGGGTQSGTAGT